MQASVYNQVEVCIKKILILQNMKLQKLKVFNDWEQKHVTTLKDWRTKGSIVHYTPKEQGKRNFQWYCATEDPQSTGEYSIQQQGSRKFVQKHEFMFCGPITVTKQDKDKDQWRQRLNLPPLLLQGRRTMYSRLISRTHTTRFSTNTWNICSQYTNP